MIKIIRRYFYFLKVGKLNNIVKTLSNYCNLLQSFTQTIDKKLNIFIIEVTFFLFCKKIHFEY